MSKTTHGDDFYRWDGQHHWRLDGSYAKTVEIDAPEVPTRLRGRTIVSVAFEENDDGQSNDLAMRLDDGSVFMVSGWGYDYWGTDVLEIIPTEYCESPLDAWKRQPCVNLSDWTFTERDAVHKPDVSG